MFKKIPFTILVLMIAALLLSACQAQRFAADGMSTSSEGAYNRVGAPQSAPAPSYADYEESKSSFTSSSGSLPDAQRIVIRNAEIALIVTDPVQSMDRIMRLAEEMGGFVVNSQLYQRSIDGGVEVPEGSLTVRVPADKLTEALDRIQSESSRLPLRRNVNSEDVTSTYVDLSSRIRNLQAAEEQLQQIMDDANRTEDVLSVYSELVRVREQIEIIQGQLNYYDQAAALSSIAVSLTADAAFQPITIAGWEPGGEARTAIRTLVSSVQALGTLGIWFVLYILPMLLLLALPVVVLIMVGRKLRQRSTPPPIPAG